MHWYVSIVHETTAILQAEYTMHVSLYDELRMWPNKNLPVHICD